MAIEQNYYKAKEYVWERLNKELDHRLYYHNINHTRKDVLPAAEQLAAKEGIVGDKLYLLLTGALFHDIGYIEQYENNEPIAARIASEVLHGFGYTTGQIEIVTSIILSTRMPQKPKTLLEEIMCDADLDSLGREEFHDLGMKLRREYIAFNNNIPENDWIHQQLLFLENHSYFTYAARELRNEGKRKNIENIKKIIELDAASQSE